MKKYKYIHYNEETDSIALGEEIKEPIIWADSLIDPDYEDVTTTSATILKELGIMQLRKEDGQAAYYETQAEMRLSRLSSGASHELFHINVYAPLSEVIRSVYLGSWIDAYDYLNETTTNLIYTEEMKIGFRIKLSTYITTSGNYEEYNNSSIDANGYII